MKIDQRNMSSLSATNQSFQQTDSSCSEKISKDLQRSATIPERKTKNQKDTMHDDLQRAKSPASDPCED